MPVIVVGGDTDAGLAIINEMVEPGREVRAFVTDEIQGANLKKLGVKVAVGDVSDDSHVEGAASNCFTAVLIGKAATDERERSFATSVSEVLEGWATAVSSSGVRRVIWVHAGETPTAQVSESARVDPADPDLVQKVVDLDEAQTLTP